MPTSHISLVPEGLVISLPRLKNDQHFQLFGEFGDLVFKIYDPVTLKIVPLHLAWKERYDAEDVALKKIRRSAHTAELRAADERRSELFRGLAGTCKLAAFHYDEQARAAAKPVQVIFDTYGNIPGKQLSEKAAAYFNLIQELGKHGQQVELLRLEGWMDELQVWNGRCQELMKERWDETAARTKIILKQARAAVDAAYEAIMKRILAFQEVAEGGERAMYDRFVERWMAVIATYNAALAHKGN